MTVETDLHGIGEAVITLPGNSSAIDTGLVVPGSDAHAIIVEVVSATNTLDGLTTVFDSGRLLALADTAAGAALDDTNSIPLSTLGFSLNFLGRLGITADDTLLFADGGTAGEITVKLWELHPDDIDLDALNADLAARVLPEPTEATRGYAVQQSEDGETFELVDPADPDPDPDADADSHSSLLAEWRTQFPEFSAVSDTVANRYLDEAGRLAASSTDATLYCAAHLAAIAPQRTAGTDAGAGVVASEQLGPMRTAYLTVAGSGDRGGSGGGGRRAFFATSVYGRMLLTIEDRSPAVAMGVLIA